MKTVAIHLVKKEVVTDLETPVACWPAYSAKSLSKMASTSAATADQAEMIKFISEESRRHVCNSLLLCRKGVSRGLK